MKFPKSKYFLLVSLTILFLLQNSFCYAIKLEVPGIPGITETSKLPDYLKAIFNYAMGLGGAMALLALIIGAVYYLTSAGNTEKMSDAVSRMKGAILGLILLLSSYIIIQTINPEIKNIEIETKYVPATLELKCGDKYSPTPLIVTNTSNMKDCSIVWRVKIDNQENCETDAAGNVIANATYVFYAYGETGFKDIKDTPIRISCGGVAVNTAGEIAISGIKSYFIQKELPGVYFYPEKDCKLSSNSLPRWNFGPGSIDSWKQGTQKSIRLVNGDDKSKGPFYGVIVFEDENQTGDEWEHKPACGNFNCSLLVRDSRCYNFDIQPVADETSVTIYQWVGFDGANLASAGNGVELRTRPNYLGGRRLISDSEITNTTGMLQIEPKNYPPDYAGTNVPTDEQKLCKNFGYNNGHCLKSIRIRGNYLLVLSDDKTNTGITGTWGGGNNSDAQRFPLSTSLLPILRSFYYDYYPQYGPFNLELDWYYNDNNKEDWLTIIPLANKLP